MTTPIQIADIVWNAQEKHLDNPDTFYAPSQDDLSTIKPGDNVKIGVEINSIEVGGASAERFWVLVIDVTDTSIIGTVNNDLIYSHFHRLNNGDLVQFDFSAVMDIIPE